MNDFNQNKDFKNPFMLSFHNTHYYTMAYVSFRKICLHEGNPATTSFKKWLFPIITQSQSLRNNQNHCFPQGENKTVEAVTS